MQVPTITPFDVSTPINQAGQATAQAFKGVGDAVDNYNRVDLMMQDQAKRKQFQDQIITDAGLDPARFPEIKSSDELGKMAMRIQAAKQATADAVKAGGLPVANEKKLMAIAVGASDDYFYRALDATQKAIEDKKKSEEERLNLQNQQAEDAAVTGAIPSMPPATRIGEASGYFAGKTYKKKTATGEEIETPLSTAAVERGVKLGYERPRDESSGSDVSWANVGLKRKELGLDYQKRAEDIHNKILELDKYKLNPKGNLDKLVADGYISKEDANIDVSKIVKVIETAQRSLKNTHKEYRDEANSLLGYKKGTGYLKPGWWTPEIEETMKAAYSDWDKKDDKEKKKLVEKYQREGKPVTAPAQELPPPVPAKEQPLPPITVGSGFDEESLKRPSLLDTSPGSFNAGVQRPGFQTVPSETGKNVAPKPVLDKKILDAIEWLKDPRNFNNPQYSQVKARVDKVYK